MAAVAIKETLEPTEFQARVLMAPENHDLFLGGGRGGAKSFCLALLALRHAEQFEIDARVLYVRKTYKAVADFELLSRDIFGKAYGRSASYNASSHTWSLPGGAYFELAQLEGPADYSKFQGRSFSLLLIDEAGEWSTPADLDRLRSNLRGPQGVPIRTVIAANPGGPGHAWLSRRYVFRAAPWTPFTEESSDRPTIYCPSTFTENPFIDRNAYAEQLRASCPGDPELLRAWLEGDWSVARGAYFGSVLSENRNAVDPWPRIIPKPDLNIGGRYEAYYRSLPRWDYFLAHDYGSTAPSVTYIVAKSPGDHGPDKRYYPRGSLILIDELATADPNNPAAGMGYTVPHLASLIIEMCQAWNVKPHGVADDAIFSNHGSQTGTIADEFRRAGVGFKPSRNKDRIGGWQLMRRMMEDAGKPDVPGLYISRRCSYFWSTVPYIGRDPRRPEDLDTRGTDHSADCIRYACVWNKPSIRVSKLTGW